MTRILIVEDDADILGLVDHRLRKAGHGTVTADSPDLALEKLSKGEQVDLAVLDVGLPGMTGLELLGRIREQLGDTFPAIFLSARVQDEDIEAGRKLGAIYLTKPFVATALLEAVEVLASGSRPSV